MQKELGKIYSYFDRSKQYKGKTSLSARTKPKIKNELDFSQEKEDKLTKFLEEAVAGEVFPGAVLGIAQGGNLIYQEAVGQISYDSDMLVDVKTVYDLASLTKVLNTTTAIMQLVEAGRINLHDYLADYFPQVKQELAEIRLDHLLTHTSGLPATVQLWKEPADKEKVLDYLLHLEPEAEPGQKILYSDPNFLLLGFIIEKVTGSKLAQYAEENIFNPLNLRYTAFNPLDNLEEIEKSDIAPTEFCQWRDKLVHGEVHDENCAFLGGASGQAGLFSNLPDLVKLVSYIFNFSSAEFDSPILSPASSRLLARSHKKINGESRGLGWDKGGQIRSSSGIYFGPRAIGHTGFTGTSIWVLPDHELSVILLSNRINGGRENQKIIQFRPRLHNLIYTLLSSKGRRSVSIGFQTEIKAENN